MLIPIRLCLALALLSECVSAAVASFGVADSRIIMPGTWSTGTVSAHTAKFDSSGYAGATLYTICIGTQARAQVFGGSTYTYIVDGGAPSTVTPAAAWTFITPFTGLSDAPHTLQIYTATSQQIYFDTTVAVEVTGAAPSLSLPTGMGTEYPIGSAPYTTYGRIDGSPVSATVQFHANTAHWLDGDGGLRFYAAATDIWIWGNTLNATGPFVVLQDGVQVGTATTNRANFWALQHLATGLDNANHLYQIVNMSAASSATGQEMYLYSVMLGGTGLTAQQATALLTLGWYGDSIVYEGSGGPTDARTGMGWLTAQMLGMASNRQGNSSQRVSTFLRDNTAQIVGSGVVPKPRVVILQGGINDQSGSIAIGDCTTAGTFQGDYKTMVSNVGAGLSAGSIIYALGVLPNTTTNSANRANYTAAQSAAVDCYMAGSPTVPAYYVSTDGWIVPATDDVAGLHPNAVGNAKIAAQLKPILAGSVYGCTAVAGGMMTGCNTVF